ncbi:GMC family oxidoreductase [Parahaliea maris]|uniref:GMC family oxidoreductase n=1 Tax=Parahaliea maris TaxID=2716870 RepID=A0A5C8ZW06_9GAMM|nr:GMC family oxidoreductase [Parahaliea maris]TXS91954.1 GMC family oxidoreductase [Parahaliea maris]
MSDNAPQFDAIVIGSGITGGWAAKELTERGLKVLMLERGAMVEHGIDYKTEHMPPWEQPFHGKPPRALYDEQYPVQRRCHAFNEGTRHFFNNDRDNPYASDPQGFSWIRANVVGGRSLLWGRQVYRWSDLDFEANSRDGHGIDWPLRYRDLAPWYSHVEKFIGVSGQAESLSHLPDSEFLPPMDLNVVERGFKHRIEQGYPDRCVTHARVAMLTRPHNGRGQCHYCGPCERGCSAGAYFSTQSSTLPAARATGNLTLKSDCVVEGIDYDPVTRRATGVRVIDANNRRRSAFTARLVFLCASTIGSTQILLNSRSEQFPNGLANNSGVLGHHLMDHYTGINGFGMVPGYEDKTIYGWRQAGLYIPRFRNLDDRSQSPDFVRGYGVQGFAFRLGWQSMAAQTPGFGADFKRALRQPGPWGIMLIGFGECLPYRDNRIELDFKRPDRFGIPQVKVHFAWGENERSIGADFLQQAGTMLESAGVQGVRMTPNSAVPGMGIHEMGTARMGDDPTESVLNRWNQAHDVPNLFVTDGACMTSSSCVNPSLTYMALTARAVDYAAAQLQTGQL